MASGLGVVLFHTTSSALKAEKLLSRSGFVVKLIPTPRELSSDCGIALRFSLEESEQLRQSLESAGVDVAGIHPLP